MDSAKISVKFFATADSTVDLAAFVPVFHALIQQHAIPEHLLIDVADYQHVHHGPGIVLVSHEANFSTDTGEGRLGLMYQRKQPIPGAANLRDRLTPIITAALRACDRLEKDPALAGRLRFGTGEILFRVHDRLLAPNTPETYREVEPELRAFLSDLYPGDEISLEPRHSPQTLFEVRARATSLPPVTDLLERLEALPLPNPATVPSR